MVVTYVIHLRIYSRHAKIVGMFSHLRLPLETHCPNFRDRAKKFTFPLIYIPARLFTNLSFSPKGTHFLKVDEPARSTPRLLWMILVTNFSTCIIYFKRSYFAWKERSPRWVKIHNLKTRKTWGSLLFEHFNALFYDFLKTHVFNIQDSF